MRCKIIPLVTDTVKQSIARLTDNKMVSIKFM